VRKIILIWFSVEIGVEIGVGVEVERQKKEDVKRCRGRGVEKRKLKKIVGPQNENE
jgi:hypothetical protein